MAQEVFGDIPLHNLWIPHANTTDFRAGDVVLVRRNLGHYVENTGDDTLIFIETFRSDHYEEVSERWPGRFPARPAAARIRRIDRATMPPADGREQDLPGFAVKSHARMTVK